MFNPLLPDISKISQEDLLIKINELSIKYQKSKNSSLRGQIIVILEQYRQEYRDRMSKQMQTDMKKLDKIINIE